MHILRKHFHDPRRVKKRAKAVIIRKRAAKGKRIARVQELSEKIRELEKNLDSIPASSVMERRLVVNRINALSIDLKSVLPKPKVK